MPVGTVRMSDPRRYFVDGSEVTEEEFDRVFPPQEGVPMAAAPSCWPMRSEALAVHPDQVAEANARNERRGSSARYEADGTCVIPDRNERRKLLKIEGFFDKNGGYGDG